MSANQIHCLAYRRALLTTGAESAPMQAHRLTCAHCASLFSEHCTIEADVRRALEVPVPDGLEARLVEHVFSAPPARAANPARRRWIVGAAAAGLAIVAIGTYVRSGRNDPLALACIDWVMKEEAKSIMMGAMPRAEAEAVLAGVLPLARIEQLGMVRHIAPCPFNGGTAYHVVLSLGANKATLLVIPDGNLAQRVRAEREGFFASVVPLKTGSVAIVATDRPIVAAIVAEVQALRG